MLIVWIGRDVVRCDLLISGEGKGIEGGNVDRKVGLIKLGIFWFEELGVVWKYGKNLMIEIVKVIVWV